MSSLETIDVLNRVLAILRRSFSQYLRYARPYVPTGERRVMEVIEQIVAGQDALAGQVSRQIVAEGTRPDSTQFPIEFTDTHDLGIDYLLQEAIGCQKQDIEELEQCAQSPGLNPAAGELVAIAIAMSIRHLELLEKLPVKPGASTIVRDGEPAYDND